MWVEYIQQLEPQAVFSACATAERLAQLEQALHITLPAELKSLLSESDGILGEYGLYLAWSADEIETQNSRWWKDFGFRTRYMSLDTLLFFADAGDGELFAMGIIEGIIQLPYVYVWNPIDDSRTWVAPSIRKYLEWWLTGKLSL